MTMIHVTSRTHLFVFVTDECSVELHDRGCTVTCDRKGILGMLADGWSSGIPEECRVSLRWSFSRRVDCNSGGTLLTVVRDGRPIWTGFLTDLNKVPDKKMQIGGCISYEDSWPVYDD